MVFCLKRSDWEVFFSFFCAFEIKNVNFVNPIKEIIMYLTRLLDHEIPPPNL